MYIGTFHLAYFFMYSIVALLRNFLTVKKERQKVKRRLFKESESGIVMCRYYVA